MIPKVIFIGQGGYHQPIEEGVAEISPVELVAELVQIVLEIPRSDVMIDIHQKPLGIADGDVDPRQDLPDLVRFDDLMDVLFHK